MQKYQRELLNLEASQSEILMDFKQLNCDLVKIPPEDSDGKKTRRKKNDRNAVSGVLGLASLIVDRDGKDPKIPEHWFQQYPLVRQDPNNYLPTGIRLEAKSLLNASFDIYYQGKQASN